MKPSTWIRTLRPALAGAALLLTTACAGYISSVGEGIVFITVGPPAPRYEVRTVSPGIEFVWISGYSRWNGRSHDWTPGRWERRPESRSVWVQGRWRHERRGWHYVEGHWQNRGKNRNRR